MKPAFYRFAPKDMTLEELAEIVDGLMRTAYGHPMGIYKEWFDQHPHMQRHFVEVEKK